MISTLNIETKNTISSEDRYDIKQAILNAELDTSSEIRVHIEDSCQGDVMRRASDIFVDLGMQKTKKRNAVLFYLAVKNRKFAVIPDYGILEKDTENFWEMLKLELLDYFRENRFSDGIIHGIGRTADYLKKFFPYENGNENQLPDDISMG